MKKCISCGHWNKNYIFIFLSIICLLLYRFFNGYIFDVEVEYEMTIFDTDTFSSHYLIHQIASYFFCIILSIIFLLKEKLDRECCETMKNKNNISIQVHNTGSFVNDLNLIYKAKSEINKPKNKNLFFFLTILLYIILEQVKIIFKKFFVHMDLWMIELYILSFLNLKIFRIEIYKHHKLAFGIIVLSIIFNAITIILTIKEGNDEKALYVRYIWTVIIALLVYFLYASCLSYSFINIKKLIDLDFISLYVILFYYGVIGTFFCSIFCLTTTYIKSNDKNDVANYLFKVTDNNNTYIDNFILYFDLFKKEDTKSYIKRNEGLNIFFIGLLYSWYKLFSFKVIKELTPLHKIFSYPLYYFLQKFFLLCIKGNIIYNEEINNYIFIRTKLILQFISDLLSIIGYLIYIEILEINFCGFNFNIRRNIIIRGDKDSFVPIINQTFTVYDANTDNDEITSNNSNSTPTDEYM